MEDPWSEPSLMSCVVWRGRSSAVSHTGRELVRVTTPGVAMHVTAHSLSGSVAAAHGMSWRHAQSTSAHSVPVQSGRLRAICTQ
eukprot:2829686-Rhodomonas_salina.2